MPVQQTTTKQAPYSSGRANLRLVPPAPDNADNWRRLMNLLFITEQDELFLWARGVRAAVEASNE